MDQNSIEALGREVFLRLERIRIQRHLRAVETKLRMQDVRKLPPECRARRAKNLDRLHEYWAAGRFPQNTQVPNRRTPVFIDTQGTPCAVASLMIRAGDKGLAETIAIEDNFVCIRSVERGPLLAWLEREGLTKEEAARIQPNYSPALDLQVFVAAIFAIFLPIKIVGDVLIRKVSGNRLAALGVTLGVVLAAIGIAVGCVTVIQPTNEPYARIYRTALVLSLLATLLPMELAALWARRSLDPTWTSKWRAASVYVGIVNVAVSSLLALIIVPVFAAMLR